MSAYSRINVSGVVSSRISRMRKSSVRTFTTSSYIRSLSYLYGRKKTASGLAVFRVVFESSIQAVPNPSASGFGYA